ncbi:MAG: RNA polymerase sigma-54 factor, partial [Simkania negevensis]|nr:RNA polymerase sigma-54 factor [Simkania negevensis]
IKMRECFTRALHTKEGVISNQKAKELLASLLKEEDQKHPFSDQELSKKLEEWGVFCARRTVTKYRKQLEILSSNKRK